MDQESRHFASQDVCFNWVDVTDEFKNAASELELGELLHDDLFGLFEAMSAIEMMDPKMDAGMMCNKISKKVLNLEQAIKVGKIKVDNVSCEEQIGIIDDTFGCLVTWLEGHSLAQTLFINLYLHNPNLIHDKCLKSFSIITLKLVDIIRDFITKANVFEEEDFQPIIYGYQLACDVTDSKACSMIREVEDDMLKKMKSYMRNKMNKASSSNPHEQSNGACAASNDTIVPEDERQQQLACALYTRLKFVRVFFQALLILKKDSIEKFQTGAGKKSTSNNDNNVMSVEKLLSQSLECMVLWQQTLDLGVKPVQPDVSSRPTVIANRADYPTIMGFEPLVNQRLLPPTFPRYTKMKSRSHAIAYLESLVIRIQSICKIYDCVSFHDALDLFNELSAKTSSPSCVLSRSIMQMLYLPHANISTHLCLTHISDLLRASARIFIKPPCLHSKSAILINSPEAKQLVDNFFNHSVRPMASLIQICGHNRARQREKLAQVLEELAALHDESEKVDSFLTNLTQKSDIPCSHLGYLSTWVLYHILRVMIQYLLSGFELELYASHEYPYIFWYLHEFLYAWMVSTLNRASNFIIDQDVLADQIQQQLKGRNHKKIKQKKRKQRPHHEEILMYQSLQHMSNGYHKVLSALTLEGKLKMPWTGLSTEQIRYEHRFGAFRNVLAPPPVSYSQYKLMTSNRFTQQHNALNLYNIAFNCFQEAKALLEQNGDKNEEISAYLKIAKTNMVVIRVLMSGHNSDNKNCPDYDFSIHKIFPIIRIYKSNSNS